MKTLSSAVLLFVLLLSVNVKAMSIDDKDVTQDSDNNKYGSVLKTIIGKKQNKLQDHLAKINPSDADRCEELCGDLKEVDCIEDKNKNFQCICKDNSRIFDEKNKKCREDPCKIKCGNGNGVECKNDNGVENIICSCKDNSKSFEEKTKTCKENKCKSMCSESDDVICKGDPVGEEDVECICKDDKKTFVKEKKECIENKCKALCGESDDVICKGDPVGEEDVECICKDDKNIFVKENKECIADNCSNSPCLNGGTCYIVPNNTSYICVCTEPYMGIKCEKNTARLKAAVIVLSIIMVLLAITCLIIFCKLKRTLTGEYEPFKN